MLRRNSADPLYVQIADRLRVRVESGEFSDAHALPSEQALCEEFGVSRTTVRRALELLEEGSFLSSRQGRGVFVREPKLSSNLTLLRGFTQFCAENDVETTSRVLSNIEIPAPLFVSRKLRQPEGAHVVYLNRVRTVDGVKAVIEEVWLPANEYDFLVREDLDDRSLYEAIEEHTGFHFDDNCLPVITLESALATGEELEMLDIEGPASVFVVSESVFSSTGAPLHFTRRVLLGDYFKYFFSDRASQLSVDVETLRDPI